MRNPLIRLVRGDNTESTLPAPGSAEAKAMFHAACSAFSRRALGGTLELTGALTREDGITFWNTQSLGVGLEEGTIAVAEYVRLHPLAAKREAHHAEVARSLNLAVLHALAYADDRPSGPGGERTILH